MTQKHTPLPWKTFLSGQQVGEIDGQGICAMWRVIYPEKSKQNIQDNAEGKANAEFIVRACNSHYDLVEALEECYRVFRMDEIDTAISMRVGMALSKARGEA